MDECLGEFELEEPGEGDGDDEVLAVFTEGDDLMGDGCPESSEFSGVEGDFSAAEQVGDGPVDHVVEFDLVVLVRATHG